MSKECAKFELRLAIQKARKAGMSTNEIADTFIATIKEDPSVELEDITTVGEELSEEEKIEKQITMVLHEFQISVYVSGYKFLSDAIMFAVKNSDYLLTKDMYPHIAQKYKVTTYTVQRAIRGLIEDAWERDNNVNEKYFGYMENSKIMPFNGVFIEQIANHIKQLS